MSKRSESAERWRRIIAGQRGSGMSVAAYCRRVRVPQSSFFAWRRRLRIADAHERGGATFAEVCVTPPTWPSGRDEGSVPNSPSDSSALELRLPGGRCIVVRAGFDRQTLLDLVAALEHGDGEVASRGAGA